MSNGVNGNGVDLGPLAKDLSRANLWATAAQKLLGQEMNTIMLFMSLTAFGYAFWWAMTVGVPAHLSQIQAGYERIAQEHGKQIEKTQAHFDKTLDRLERRVEARAATALTRPDE